MTTRLEVAQDPNSSPAQLELVHEAQPAAVLANPVTLLYLLADPSWFVPAACQRRLQVQEYLQEYPRAETSLADCWRYGSDTFGDGDDGGYGEAGGDGAGFGAMIGWEFGDGSCIFGLAYGSSNHDGSGAGNERKARP